MVQTKVVRTTGVRGLDWRTGAIAGIVGAIVYTLFVEAVNVAAHGVGAFFFPFRQIGAVVLGPRALNDTYDVLAATAAGTVAHFAIAAAFGIFLAWIASRIATLSTGGIIALSVIAGLAFYAVNVLIIFPAAFPWFLDNSRLTQSLGHAIFGGVTGAWLAWRRAA